MPVHGSRLYPASQAVCAYNRRQDTGKLKALPRGLQDEADKALAQGLRPFDELVNRVPAEVRELAKLKSQKFKDHVRDRLKECIQACCQPSSSSPMPSRLETSRRISVARSWSGPSGERTPSSF